MKLALRKVDKSDGETQILLPINGLVHQKVLLLVLEERDARVTRVFDHLELRLDHLDVWLNDVAALGLLAAEYWNRLLHDAVSVTVILLLILFPLLFDDASEQVSAFFVSEPLFDGNTLIFLFRNVEQLNVSCRHLFLDLMHLTQHVCQVLLQILVILRWVVSYILTFPQKGVLRNLVVGGWRGF